MNKTKLLGLAEAAACGCSDDQDWCRVCARPTCHWGEHSDEQLLKFYMMEVVR